MVERKLVNWAKCSLSISLRCEAQRKALVTLVASFLPVESIGVPRTSLFEGPEPQAVAK